MRTSAAAPEPSGRPDGAPAHSLPCSLRARPPAAQLITRRQRISLLCLAIPLMDQASKAVQPAGTFTVNTGGPAILPSALGDALWKSQTLGAACDSIDTVLLIAALGAVRMVTNTGQRVAVTAVLAGLLSNLVDRLGASSLFHAGLPRGSIDWITVPAWPSAKTNIADIVITLGTLALIYHAGHRMLRASRALARLVPASRLAAAATGIIALAIWTAIWQANRHTAELRPANRYETPSQCQAAIAYSSDGMDWVSYRPAGGPLPYYDRSCRTAVSRRSR
jgi:Signal peptidase (SPase) II